MQIVAKSVSVVQEIKFTELVPAERRCAYCQNPFTSDEEVVILSKTIYGNDEIDMPDDSIYVLHVRNPVDGNESCLEEFVAKTIVYQADVGEKPSENVKKDGETVTTIEPASQST